MTYTFVRYFGEDQVDPITQAFDELQADWVQRSPHLREGDRLAGDQRVKAVELALARLTDEVAM